MIASFHALPRRFARRTSLGFASALALLGSSQAAFAQAAAAEAQKPAPNVLLLVDSSGSMEFKTDGTLPSCVPGGTSTKSRWIELVEVLTGKIDNYSCWPQDRSSTNFRTEFSLGGTDPYDYRYVNKYHRALSNSCLYGPGLVPIPAATPYAWPAGAVNTFPLVGGTSAGLGTVNRASPGCTFSQSTDGLLDLYKDMVRFGLMTFDARVGTGTGVVSGLSDYPGGFDGNWSYYVGSASTGHPANCAPGTPVFQEVGARNAAAPPWEGRMIGFGPPNASSASSNQRNAWIQQVLLSTRPYGATPIAGQLDDARQFLWNDTSADPLNAGEKFGPTNDPNWRASNCRKTILVLLTDGEPNLDLRPYCAMTGTPNGQCPYNEPERIVEALFKGTGAPQTNMSVETYVVGFAIDEVTPALGLPVPCEELDPLECGKPANEANRPLQTCCTLNKIANAGGKEDDGVTPRNARFAKSQPELKAIFTDILDDVIQIATRTTPVYSSPGGDSVSKGFKFFSAFDPRPDPTQPQLWEGILERSRFVCSDTGVPEVEFEPTDGDDFAANLNSGSGPTRNFYTMIGANNRRSMRPYVTADTDNIGLGTGSEIKATLPADLVGQIPAAALDVTAATCPGAAASDNACRDLIMQHVLGINTTGPSRCINGNCSLLGGIYHSVPTAVPGRPSDLLRDESYEDFIARMFTIKRPSILYTSTVDGFLHAFNLAPFPGSTGADTRRIKDVSNNELWAFIPPAVVPVLKLQYPATQAVLLDGLPIVKDVVATVTGTDPSRVVQNYERNQSQARTGNGDWRTVLVQGFGYGIAQTGMVPGGYFALDITEPDRGQGDGKPIFRWQLTQTSSGAALFGTGGTPLITTVFIGDGSAAREVAVAVLPGGDASPSTGSAATIGESVIEVEPTDITPTRKGRSYPGAENARSLSIVRLDTGAVIRTFRPNVGPFSTGVVQVTDIPAPITGQPKAYPEVTGSVADRIYVGDRDGRLWRVDVSSQDPTKWRMAIFYDAFRDLGTAGSQPVVLPPVLSVDEVGDVTVAFATGGQELDNTDNRVLSVTETLVRKVEETDQNFMAHLNWIHRLDNGDRVTGPMVLFNSGLFYAVSHPPVTTGNACDVGSSKVYGVHYIQSKDFEDAAADNDPPDPETGPAPAPNYSDIEIARQPGLVFGVSLEAEPSCFDEPETIADNESFGYGTVTMAKKVTPGKYYLTYGASGNSGDPRGVLEVKQQLPSPDLAVTFDSWAVVYE
jgi:type IV pilus assembly protein PilY1